MAQRSAAARSKLGTQLKNRIDLRAAQKASHRPNPQKYLSEEAQTISARDLGESPPTHSKDIYDWVVWGSSPKDTKLYNTGDFFTWLISVSVVALPCVLFSQYTRATDLYGYNKDYEIAKQMEAAEQARLHGYNDKYQ